MIAFSLFAKTIMIDNFQTDIFSKVNNDLQKIEVSLVFDVSDDVPKYKLEDGVNIVISSFYLEDLFTSKSKESFKELLKSYLNKKHSVVVNSIYIKKMQKKQTVSIDELVKKIKNLTKEDK
jgi:hypothetical protein